MPDGTQLYCLGQRLQGTRRLSDDELVELRRHSAASIRRHRHEHLLRTSLVIVAGLAAVVFAVGWPDEESVGLTVGAALGVFLFALVPCAVIQAFVFPRLPFERTASSFVIISANTLGLFGHALPNWLISLLAWPSVLAGLLGILVWLFRGLDARRIGPALAALPLDAEAGEVLVFDGSEPKSERFEVLPCSRLLYHSGVTDLNAWERVEIDEVANPPESPREWVVREGEDPWGDEDHWYRARKLLPSEMDELQRMVARLPRQAIVELLGVLIAAAILTQVVQYALSVLATVFETDMVSGAAWVAVVLIVLGRGVRLAREWRALRADLRRGEVLRARSAGQSAMKAEVVAELLPESGVIWTEAGQPADWRHT